MELETDWIDCWKKPVKVQYKKITKTEEITTREGKLYGYADKDVLLKGIKGEVYPCKIDIFNATYTTTEPLSPQAIRAEVFKEIEVLTLKYSGECDNPFCRYGDEAEKEYSKLKDKE